jgi:hypothetical protein
MGGMARLEVTPERVGILEFEQRLPSAIGRALAVAAATWPSSPSAGAFGRLAAMAIRAQDATFLELRDQVRAAARIRDYRHFTTFVAQMVEIEHNWICFATQNTRMLAQIVVDQCSIPMTASQSTTHALDPLIVWPASLR